MASAQTALLPAYLVVGEDELKRGSALKRLRQRMPADLVDFNLDELDAKTIEDPASLLVSLETMPFMADFRLVILHALGGAPKDLSDALVGYLKNPNPACVLCMETEKLAKNTRLYKAFAKVGPKAVIDCSPIKRWELPAHVAKLAGGMGLSIESRAAEELVSRSGESTMMLSNQLKTLAELLAPRTAITLADVEANVAQVAEVSPWAFADAVCERKPARAMELLHLMDKPSLVFLHSVLVGRLRELICAKSLEARGASGRLAQELGFPSNMGWKFKNHARWARSFTMEELLGCLDEAAACERALKGSADSDTAFTTFVLRIAAGR